MWCGGEARTTIAAARRKISRDLASAEWRAGGVIFGDVATYRFSTCDARSASMRAPAAISAAPRDAAADDARVAARPPPILPPTSPAATTLSISADISAKVPFISESNGATRG